MNKEDIIFPNTTKSGQIFNDFLYDHDNFNNKYKRLSKSFFDNQVPMPGYHGCSFMVSSDYNGPTEMLSIMESNSFPIKQLVCHMSKDKMQYQSMLSYLKSSSHFTLEEEGSSGYSFQCYVYTDKLARINIIEIKLECDNSQRYATTMVLHYLI